DAASASIPGSLPSHLTTPPLREGDDRGSVTAYCTSRLRRNTMKRLLHLLIALAFLSEARAQDVKRNIPYAEPAHERQVLDVYSPQNAKNLPVVFWIHGGGWQTGDKTSVQMKPQVFVDKGFVFVSTNYRLLPSVDMGTIVR